MYINGVDKEDAIRSTALALVMRPVVVCRPLREKMVILQRAMGKMNDIVADGRDMGTVVFPNADYKFFLTCDLETRVVRRMRQLTIQGLEVDEDAIRREIILRDETDYLGPDAINKKSPDAQIIDTTSLTISDQVAVIMNTIRIN
jgi:cytidylate kinase